MVQTPNAPDDIHRGEEEVSFHFANKTLNRAPHVDIAIEIDNEDQIIISPIQEHIFKELREHFFDSPFQT